MRAFLGLLLGIAGLVPQIAGAQTAGTLIAADPVVETPAGTQAWRVRYWTTSDRGQPIEVTGMVIAPREALPAQPRPVIAWAHGSWGVAGKCSPSQSPNFFAATPGLIESIQRGYTVVASDYPGLGGEQGSGIPHPFLVGSSTAQSVLDAVRAAQAIPGAAAGRRFAVWGESQGGHAALWTGQLAQRYAPGLELLGVAAAAPPTDLTENLRAGKDPSVRAMFTAFTAHSWSQHFNVPLSTLGKRPTQGVITRLAQNNCIELGKKPKLGTMLGVLVLRRELKDVDVGVIQPWAGIAADNSPSARDYGVPFLIAQNPGDTLVAETVTKRFVRKLCRSGARLHYISIAGKGHETSARDTITPTLDWIDARVQGAKAPSDCGKI